jgi:hypothetical protein
MEEGAAARQRAVDGLPVTRAPKNIARNTIPMTWKVSIQRPCSSFFCLPQLCLYRTGFKIT